MLEKATGKNYEALIRKNIFEPAGMKDSGVLRTGQIIPQLARGYQKQGGRLVPTELGVTVEALDGAGTLFTTARDLWRFDRALAAEKILPRKAQALMLSQQVKGRFGYGWFLSEQGGKYFPWHEGSYRGHAAVFVRQVQRDEAIMILSNLQDADVLELRTKVLRILKANTAP